jgi:hypothetical protein
MFAGKAFREISNNYSGLKSFCESGQNVENSSRKVADQHPRCHIRQSEVLPTAKRVDFSQDPNVLLAENENGFEQLIMSPP